MIHDGHKAWVVDPGDAAPVIEALDELGLSLAGILVTHHHGDHVGGLVGLSHRLQGPVFGPALERIPEPFQPVRQGERIEVLGLQFEVIDVPGHTLGHVAYFSGGTATVSSLGRPVLFCGDTLFSGGCGRLFEGTPEQMHDSLDRLSGLPDDTAVCCAHEYTLSNLKFARAVEPDNTALAQHTAWCEAQRAQARPTLPGRLDVERRINPFLRCSEPAVRAAARSRAPAARTPTEVFAALRQWKNEFR